MTCNTKRKLSLIKNLCWKFVYDKISNAAAVVCISLRFIGNLGRIETTNSSVESWPKPTATRAN